MSRARKPDKKPPSRQRYEESHPVVTLRLPLDVYKRFKKVTAAEGASAALRVKERLDQDDVRARAVAERLARERDGLGHQIVERRQEMARLDGLIEQRKGELAASVDVQRAKMLKEVDAERERRLETVALEVQTEKSIRISRLATLSADIEAKKKQYLDIVGDSARAQFSLDLLNRELRNCQAMKERLLRQVIEFARQSGVPAVICFSCPAYNMYRPVLEAALKIAHELPPQGG